MTASPEGDRLAELRASARGWHGAQLAVLGLISLCGVLRGAAGEGSPSWLQVLSGLLVLVALALSCLAIGLVAAAAWPVDVGRSADRDTTGAETTTGAMTTQVRAVARRLRRGITLTFVAVAVLAIATTSSWWPRPTTPSAQVEVTTSTGVICGTLQDATPGLLAVEVTGRRIVLSLREVVQVRAVPACE